MPSKSSRQDRQGWRNTLFTIHVNLQRERLKLDHLNTPAEIAETVGITEGTLNDMNPDQAAKEVKNLLQDRREELLKCIDLSRELAVELEEIWRLQDFAESNKEMGTIGVMVGAILGAIGFGLWWSRVQRFQDRTSDRRSKQKQERLIFFQYQDSVLGGLAKCLSLKTWAISKKQLTPYLNFDGDECKYMCINLTLILAAVS